MPSLFRLLIPATILFSQSLYAVSVEDYIAACVANQGNRMGPELCECVGHKGKTLSDEEFDFFYALAAKDQNKINEGHTTLDANQKMSVIQLSMMGPSKCANELAAQQNSSGKPNSSESSSASSASIASEAADSASE